MPLKTGRRQDDCRPLVGVRFLPLPIDLKLEEAEERVYFGGRK